MADIGLNPVMTRHDRVEGGDATVTGIKFGMAVIADNTTNNSRDVKLPGAAGCVQVRGINVSQTDPSTGSAVGDTLEICTSGICECYLLAGETVAKDQEMIIGNTSGHLKPVALEAKPYTVVGRSRQNATAGASAIMIAVEINPHDLTA